MAYLKSIATTFVWISTFLAAITYLPGLPPYVEFSIYDFNHPVGINKSPNGKLDGVEKLFEGQIKGPESFESHDGVLYTSLHHGYVSKLVGDKLVNVVKFGQKCDGFWEEHKCGRPLGLKFDKQGRLYVIDAYYGIFRVDVKTGKYEKIIDTSILIEGEIPMLPNSIDVANNGDLYWTSSSSQFNINDGLFAILSNPNGRLIRYNAATKQNEVLIEKLGFGNGIKLSDDESFLIVSETMKSRILKYHLKGPQSGKSEIFSEALPGMPDNIHTDGRGNFLVSLISAADEEHPIITQILVNHPNLRKMIVRLGFLLEMPFRFLDQIYPNYYSKRIVHWLGHFESAYFIFTPNSAVVRIDPTGKIIDILESSDDNINGISSAYPFEDYLYLGSPFNEFLARVPLEKTLPDLKKNYRTKPQLVKQTPTPIIDQKAVPRPEEMSTTTTERPLTTTPKPPVSTPSVTAAPPLPPTPTTPPSIQAPKVTIEPKESPLVVESPEIPKHGKTPTTSNSTEKPVVPRPTKQILKDEM